MIAPRTPNAAVAAPAQNKNPVEALQNLDAYDDNTLMPFGKYRGTPLCNVPPSWFRWYLEQDKPSDTRLYDYAKERYS